jgi:dTMP kinase
MKPKYPGLFVTIEGGDGAGKTTLQKHLAAELSSQGHQVLTTREPGGTPFGEKVRELLLNGHIHSPYAELCLFLSARAEHVQEVIVPALRAGKIILCDRFNDSSIAYQGAARGLGKERVAEVCSFVCEGLTPDLTFFLDVPAAVSFARAKKRDRIEDEGIAFQEAVREAFLEMAEKAPQRYHTIDATLSPSDIFAEALRVLLSRIKQHV